MNFLKPLLSSFLDFCYPPLCLHCQSPLLAEGSLCQACAYLLELIEPAERCHACFSINFCPLKKICAGCNPSESYLHEVAAAFDYLGPAASIVKRLKYGDSPYLAKGAAAFLLTQFLRLEWPMPDVIIPVPLSFIHHLMRGYNQSALLAKELASLLQIPYQSPLKRLSGDFSQAGLTSQQRKALTAATLKLSENHQLYDQRVLLIDDVMTTGATLQRCAEVLIGGCPKEIYALTFCRAVKDR